GRDLFLHPDPGASPDRRCRGGGADGPRAVLSGDALPLLAGGAARSGRGAALRMSPPLWLDRPSASFETPAAPAPQDEVFFLMPSTAYLILRSASGVNPAARLEGRMTPMHLR